MTSYLAFLPLEGFSRVEKYLVLHLLPNTISEKKLRHFFNQSQVKPKPVATHLH